MNSMLRTVAKSGNDIVAPLRSSPRFRRKAHPTCEDAEKCLRTKQRRVSPSQTLSNRSRRRRPANSHILATTATTEASSTAIAAASSAPTKTKQKNKRSQTVSNTSSLWSSVTGADQSRRLVLDKLCLTKLELDERHCSAPPLVGNDKLRDHAMVTSIAMSMTSPNDISDGSKLSSGINEPTGSVSSVSIRPDLDFALKTNRSSLKNLRRSRRLHDACNSTTDKPAKSRRRSVSKSPSGNPWPDATPELVGNTRTGCTDFSLPSSTSSSLLSASSAPMTAPGTPFSPATALGSMFISTPDAAPQSVSASSNSSKKPLSAFSLGGAHDATSASVRMTHKAAMVVSINPRPTSTNSTAEVRASSISDSHNKRNSVANKRPQSGETVVVNNQKSTSSGTVESAQKSEGEKSSESTDFNFLSLSKPRGLRIRSVASLDEMVREALIGHELGDEMVGRTATFVTGCRIDHQWFGEGVVESNDMKILVCKFDKAPNDAKKLSARHAVPNMVLLSTPASIANGSSTPIPSGSSMSMPVSAVSASRVISNS